MPNAKHSGRRNAQYMRKSLGFFPCAKSDSDFFETLNLRAVSFLANQKISGHNARDKFDLIGSYAEGEAEWMKSEGRPETMNACYTLAFATVFAAMGSYDSYNLIKNSKKSQ